MPYGSAVPGSGPPLPYDPPSSKFGSGRNGSSNGNGGGIKYVALATKSFRVFGLMRDDAWRAARDGHRAQAVRQGGDEDAEEEFDDMTQISNAVFLALSPEAGGYGTAGNHMSRVEDVELDGTDVAVWNGLLVPCKAGSNGEDEELDAEVVALGGREGGKGEFEGNDGRYVAAGPFGLRVTVSRASEALRARRAVEKEYKEVQRRHENTNGGEDKEDEDEHDDGDGDGQGYYVEMMLLEPGVPEIEAALPPPHKMDKGNPNATASTPPPSGGDARSSYSENVFASQQFVKAGPWEKANLKSFDEISLDLRKSLVRVEFPLFPEGCQGKTFRQVYQLNARLKSGSFATVCRGTHRATGKKIAVKCVLRKDLPPNDDAAIYDEVLILSTLRHRYICPLIDFFEERDCYFLVMELMSGGDLFDRIGKKKSYSEQDARDLCRKMLESLRYCHDNSVAHCDMKPKNLLLLSDDDNVQVKLADFGFATRVYEPNTLTKQCGTPFFVAPEVLMRSPYDQQSDMWSVGVIMYLLLSGDLPFMGKSQKELFRKIVVGRYSFPDESWGQVSDEAKELIQKLLVTDPKKRLTSREAMATSWIRQRGQLLAKNKLTYTSQRLKTFNARMRLRSAMIAVDWTVSLRKMTSFGGSAKGAGLAGVAAAARRSSASSNPLLGKLTEMVKQEKEKKIKEENGAS